MFRFFLAFALAVCMTACDLAKDPARGPAEEAARSDCGGEGSLVAVNGHPVEPCEYRWFMEQERAGVVAFFKAQYNLEGGADFWDRQVSGLAPRQMLQDRTADRIMRAKTQQLLFADLGLIPDASYSGFLEAWEQTNADRAAAAAKGRAVYGPVHYSQTQFYGHWMASLQIAAKEKLNQTKWKITEEMIRAFYNQRQDRFRSTKDGAPLSFEEVSGRVLGELLDEEYEKTIRRLVEQAQVGLHHCTENSCAPRSVPFPEGTGLPQ